MIFLDLLKFFFFLILVPLPVGAVAHLVFFNQEKISILNSLTLGLLSSTLCYFIFLHLFGHSLSLYLILLISVVTWLGLGLKKQISKLYFQLPSLLGVIFILLSVYINSLLLVPFGQISSQGVALSGAHFVDSTWHLAIINALNSSFPPDNPLYAGNPLTNYHYLVDLLASLIHRVTGTSIPVLFFQVLGPFLLLLFCLHIYNFLKRTAGKEIAGLAGLILITLSSNLYYLASHFFAQASITPSVAWIEFYSSKVVNYPLLFSLSVVFVLMEIVVALKKPNVLQSICLGLLSGGLFGFKAHTALVWLAGLGLLSLYSLFKRNFTYLLSSVIAFIVIWSFSSSMVSSGSSSIRFEPLWFIKVMFETTDHLNYPVWELKRQTLLAAHSYLGITKLYAQGLFWFLIINFGFSLMGIFALFKRQLSMHLKLVLTALIVSGLGLTLSFVLVSTAIVTIQFAYLTLIALNILLAILLASFIRDHKLPTIAILVLLWACLLPGVRLVTSGYQNTKNVYNYDSEMTQVAAFLKLQPANSVVLVEPEMRSGSFIPGYSGQHLFLGDPQILEGLFINHSSRQDDTLSFLNCQNTSIPVDYILVSSGTNLSRCAQLVFSTEKYTIYFNSNNPHNKLP